MSNRNNWFDDWREEFNADTSHPYRVTRGQTFEGSKPGSRITSYVTARGVILVMEYPGVDGHDVYLPADLNNSIANTRAALDTFMLGKRRRWTVNDEARIAAMWAAGKTPGEIARVVHRSPQAVHARLSKLGLV